MTNSSKPTRLDIAKAFVTRIGHRDFDVDLLSSEITYRAIGTHSLAGQFSGRDEVKRHLEEVAERTTGSFDTENWDDWLVGENHVAAVGKIRVQARNKTFRGHLLFLVQFDIADKIIEINVFFEDQRAVERFFDQ